MVLTVFAGIAEFERSLIRERTGAGRVAAKKRGVKFGRKPKLTPKQIVLATIDRRAGEPSDLRYDGQTTPAGGPHLGCCKESLPTLIELCPDRVPA